MRCYAPGVIPQTLNGVKSYVTVPCGKCLACLSNKRQEWSFRLEQELRDSRSAFFVTLTYSDLVDPDTGEISNPVDVSKRDCQLFLKRLRRSLPSCSIRYFLTAEYGPTTFRPHYHAIIFNIPGSLDFVDKVIFDAWGLGHIHVGRCEPASISYVAKYCITRHDFPPGREPPFSLMSRRPGIGHLYPGRYVKWHQSDLNRFYAVKPGGLKVSLPRYYRERVYSDAQRKYHSLLLDKENNSPEAYEKFLIERSDVEKRTDKNYFEHDSEQKLNYIDILTRRLTKMSKI